MSRPGEKITRKTIMMQVTMNGDHDDAGDGDDHGDAGSGDGDYHDQGSRICWKRGIGVGKMDLSRGNERIETNSAVLWICF